MSWASDVRAQVDAAALAACRRNKSWIESWAQGDQARISALRVHLLRLLRALWPMGGDIPLDRHVTVASVDIDMIPAALLDDLSDTLARRARELRSLDAAASAAHEIMAGWLICRRLELRDRSSCRIDAAQLRSDHERFVRALLCPDRSAVA